MKNVNHTIGDVFREVGAAATHIGRYFMRTLSRMSWPALLASWHWLLASILLATCLRFLLQNWGQGKMPIARAAFILLLEPVWTALLASWWFGSVMTGLQWLGAGLILAAILVSRHKPRRPASLQSPVPAGKTGQ